MSKLSASTARQSLKDPCRFYVLGICSKGNACQFTHERPNESTSSSPSSNVTLSTGHRPESNSKKPSCRYFASGTCTRGTSCPFPHEEPSKAPPSANTLPVPQPRADSRSQTPCQFFAKGYCRNGDICPYSHAKLDTLEGARKQNRELDEEVPNEAHFHDDWTREFGGALVKFEDGGKISKISLPSDFSAIRLNKLPPGSSPISVATLLSSLDVVVSPDNVRVIAQPGMAGCSADVKVEDPTFAQTVCCTTLSQIEAVHIAVPMPRGSGLHRVDCRRVNCSWHRPTRTAWLNFGYQKAAQKVYEQFNTGNYKVLGCTVKAKEPTGSSDYWNPYAWTVMLTDLAGTVEEQDIYQAIPKFHKPRNVVMGEPTYNTEMDYSTTIVKSMLSKFGPLEWWEASVNPNGKRIKASARFFDESHAREAASSLKNKSLPFNRTARLTVGLITVAKFKVSSRIYDVLSERLNSQTPTWENRYKVYFAAYPSQQRYRVLKLEGEDSKLVAQAKEALGRIINGEVARKDGKDLWSTSLGRNGEEFERLKQVEKDHGVVVVRDRRRSQLRLFGTEERCKRATEALEMLIQEGNLDSHVIKLNSDEFQWACRGGFKALTVHLGENKATFDIASTPKRILIGGTNEDYEAALAVIASRQVGVMTTSSNSDQTECSVCWNEADEPVRTSCNHVYCSGCFADMCRSGTSASTEFCISCIGGEGRCEKVLALSEIQEFLSSAAFESVLEASFTSYVRQHPSIFRYCSTPDCGQIYRVANTMVEGTASSPTVFTCVKCLIPTCTSCHSLHPGLTCADHKEVASGRYEALAKVKKELGIKDCARCKTAIEKTEGCNHMTCGGCKAHICWVCMATFDTSSECYAHLNKMHNGAFDHTDVVF
ncbi:hypothetical protein F4810DRAFT_672340 [Camillea tinctor]|nr:hypothetical protein F4810DRAFT_672340 [Camillea tinctor]